MSVSTEQDVRSLRLDHRALRAERSRVTWWRRLVRAELDLLVARTVRPPSLGEELAFTLPIDVELEVPRAGELDALLGPAGAGDVARLEELRELDQRLARYQTGVEEAFVRATDALLDHLANDHDAPAGSAGETDHRL